VPARRLSNTKVVPRYRHCACGRRCRLSCAARPWRRLLLNADLPSLDATVVRPRCAGFAVARRRRRAWPAPRLVWISPNLDLPTPPLPAHTISNAYAGGDVVRYVRSMLFRKNRRERTGATTVKLCRRMTPYSVNNGIVPVARSYPSSTTMCRLACRLARGTVPAPATPSCLALHYLLLPT